jgi:hypothetical protein
VSAAEEAVKFNDKEYAYARSLGAAYYRAARYEDAVNELTRALALRKQPSPAVWLLLAMAQQRCKRDDVAKEWLGKARDWIAQARQSKSNEEVGLTWSRLPWTERLVLELLEAEASKLIGGLPPSK